MENPTEVFNRLITKVKNSPHEMALLKILQHLLHYDSNNSETGKMWSEIDDILQKSVQPKSQGILGQKLKEPSQNERVKAKRTDLNKTSTNTLPPPPPPPLLGNSPGSNRYKGGTDKIAGILPQQDLPIPKKRMRTMYWESIPPHEILGNKNIWTNLANSNRKTFRNVIDWQETETLFCLPTTSTLEPTMRRAAKIKLLNAQRSFNVDIFLEQFKGFKSDDAIVELVLLAKNELMGAEKIRRLVKLLPNTEEVATLKNYDGNRKHLARAEKFLLQLIEIPHYQLRLECMSLKEDFNEHLEQLNESIKLILQAGSELLNNKNLHEILFIIVLVGNYLNSGKFSGNAIGIRISSLGKLTQTRSNLNNLHILHFIVSQIKVQAPYLINIPNGLKAMHKAAKLNIEQVMIDAKNMCIRVRNVKTQIELLPLDSDIRQKMGKFLTNAKDENENLKAFLNEVETMRCRLSEFFCENPTKFKLRDCFEAFATFAEDFKRSIDELSELETKVLRIQRQADEDKKTRNLMTNVSTSISDVKGDTSRLLEETPRNAKADLLKRVFSEKRKSEMEQPLATNIAKKIKNFGRKNNSQPTGVENQRSLTNTTMPKIEKIGVRLVDINEVSLQNAITKLKPTRKSLWDVPREKLLKNNLNNRINSTDTDPSRTIEKNGNTTSRLPSSSHDDIKDDDAKSERGPKAASKQFFSSVMRKLSFFPKKKSRK
uniref:FH2 domain-containing protein n=1 Tax=Stomoxys calcitrans TaxID=35570 RepID=A0A1I8NPT8_STOCA